MKPQVEQVRRRLIYAEFRQHIDSAVVRLLWDRELIIDGLLLCGGDMHRLNEHWREWRRRDPDKSRPRGGREQRAFHDFLTSQERLRQAAARLQNGLR